MRKLLHISINTIRRIPNVRSENISNTISSIANEQIVPPAHGTYKELLFDERWRAKRGQILTRDNFKCIICGHNENLQVHHRQYHYVKTINQFKPPWDYGDDLLITLCKSCHNRGHSKYKVPTLSV